MPKDQASNPKLVSSLFHQLKFGILNAVFKVDNVVLKGIYCVVLNRPYGLYTLLTSIITTKQNQEIIIINNYLEVNNNTKSIMNQQTE
jgi:L-cystine uptake protein TcyP (sodium:dicarboxylate symporter family)